MPRPTMPPTPVSSTEIKGQDASHRLSTMQMSFELPPSAIGGHDASSRPTSSDTKAQARSPRLPYPVQASETVKSRRRSSAAQQQEKEAFTLPPPPTRSRKIIQMKPRAQQEPVDEPTPAKTSQAGTAKSTGVSTSKKKQPSATSAAGRKIARKTAHSLIERRRRSKMNEEYAILKGLVPACTGEMHKLAILQASIDYVRYLEDCVSKLKSQRDSQSSVPTPTEFILHLPAAREAYTAEDRQDDEDEGSDVEMTGSEATSPTCTQPHHSRSQQPSISPVLVAEDVRHRNNSYPSVSTDHRHYSQSASLAVSPALGPQMYGYARNPPSVTNSALTSPALAPQRDVDQEAMTALLMLNTDRRGTSSNGPARGMSVRDLLSA